MPDHRRPFRNYEEEFAYIEDPIQARELILEAIDEAPLGWAQVRAVIVGGIGFLTDSYDLFAISLITDMLGIVYFKSRLPANIETAIKLSAQIGALIGQAFFGWLADRLGRKRVYGLELVLIILTTLGQCLSASSSSKAVTITGLTIFWRVLMGIGIGGDYPISSVIVSEFAATRWRGGMVAAVFAMQGVGQFFASVVALIVTNAFKSSITDENMGGQNTCHSTGGGSSECNTTAVALESVDRMWRIIVGIGVVPAVLALYFRLTIPETPRYTFDVTREVVQATADTFAWIKDEINPRHSQGSISEDQRQRNDQWQHQEAGGLDQTRVPVSSWKDFVGYFGKWENGRILLGTSLSWLLVDLAYYGFSLNIPLILQTINIGDFSGPVGDEPYSIYKLLRHNALGNLILVCAGGIPGYLLTVFTVDKIGRKWIQIQGFAILTLLLVIRGFASTRIGDNGKIVLYVLCQFFFNFGPNATTFIVPGECFPTRYRGTGHGISAAVGKLGAVGAQAILYALRSKNPSDDVWLSHVMETLALFTLLGVGSSLLIIETKGRTLEELAEPGKLREAEKNHFSLSRRQNVGVMGVVEEAVTPPVVQNGHAPDRNAAIELKE